MGLRAGLLDSLHMNRIVFTATFVLALLVSSSASAQLIISEVAWMGSPSSSSDEWIEIHNPTGAAIDLANFELLQGTSVRTLPNYSIEAGAFVVVERRDEATSIGAEGAVTLSFGSGLTNGGQVLRLCPLGQSANAASCDTASEGAWPAGNSSARQTMIRVEPFSPTNFVTYEGGASSVVDSGGLGIFGTPGANPEIEGGADAGPDAGSVDVAPFEYEGLAITEIYFNPPTNAESGKEWVEIANLSTQNIPLQGAVLERLEGVQSPTVARTATLQSSRVLAPSERIVVAGTRDLNVGACAGDDVIVLESSEFSLANSGTQTLRITQNGIVNEVRYAGSGVSAVPEGSALALIDDDADNTVGANLQAADCEFAEGVFGSPGVRNEDCAQSGPLVCEGLPDAGVPTDDAGLPPGPNATPTIVLSAPAASSEAPVEISWNASDDDVGDTLEVALFYDEDATGNDGVAITRGLPSSGTFTWTPDASVPAGEFSILASVTDRRGATSFSYAPGSVSVSGEALAAEIVVVNPDGVNDVDETTNNVLIEWTVTVPDAQGAQVRLFFDTDNSGFDGEPIVAGLPVLNADGTDAARRYVWDTSAVESGNYTVYARLDWSGGSEQAYGESVTIEQNGDCSSAPKTSFAALFLVTLIFSRRRKTRDMIQH